MNEEEKYVRYFCAALGTFGASTAYSGDPWKIETAHRMARYALRLDPYRNQSAQMPAAVDVPQPQGFNSNLAEIRHI